MKYIKYLILLIIAGSCKTAKVLPPPPPPPPVILTIGNQEFKTADFFQSFTKNQFSNDTTKPTGLAEYLELYTNLKLKIIDAQSKGLDTTASFNEELASYKKQLAQPYLTDKVLIDYLVAEAYQRSKEEIRAAHILTAVPLLASPADTLAAYRATLAMRAKLQEGEDFGEMAKRFSKDTLTASKGGDLGYFTVFSMVYPIENLLYQSQVGKIVGPIRTAAGYHLIKILDRRPSRGKIQVAHIRVTVSSSATPEGQKAALAKIEEASERIKQGEAFENVCREFSDDRTSKQNGGVLPAFGVGTMVPTFEEAAYALQGIGDISKPFKTNYGWHIIKLLNRLPVPSFTEMAPSLKLKVTTDSRKEVVQENLISKLRKNYETEEIKSVKEDAFEQLDSTLLKGTWKLPKKSTLEAKTILNIEKEAFTVDNFFDFIQKNQIPKPIGTSLALLKQYYFKQFQNKKLIEVEEQNLDKKYPEFNTLVTEVHDGMLLSQMMEEHVWSKSITDTTAQRKLYEQTKSNYRYPERAFATILTADNEAAFNSATEILAKKPYQLKRKGTDLLFGPNQTVLTEAHREALFDVAATLINNENYLVEISGYSDSKEADSLSSIRIKNAVKVLTNSRIPLTRLLEKDFQKFYPVADATRNRRVSFQFLSNATKDVEKAINALKIGKISISEGVYNKGSNTYLNASAWQTGNRKLKIDNKNVWIDISKIEPPRIKTFAEARGAVINNLQKKLESEYLTKLKERFPVVRNEEEIKKLTK